MNDPVSAPPGVATPPLTFAAFGLPPPLAQALDVLGFTVPTPVQAQALAPVLAQRDVIAQARTGSGKTVAFGLGLLNRIDVSLAQVQALVLCPTRELADQVSTALRQLGRFMPNLRLVTLCGGVPVRTQRPALESPPQVVVGTPGRILDHLERETLDLQHVRVLVLDEADRMLDMGFLEAISAVVTRVPAARQTLLFSATFPAPIRTLSRTLQTRPLEVTVDSGNVHADVEEVFFAVEAAARLDALIAVLLHEQPESALVFCQTRNDVRDLTRTLAERGFSVLALHGELLQRERDEVLLRFANGSCAVLVATDVAARGLDIKGLSAVFSWELSPDSDIHVHRLGRTGRAGERGRAFSFCTPRERGRASAIEDAQEAPLRWRPVPALVLRRPGPAKMRTLVIDGGRTDKLRPGDLLGALTGDLGLSGDVVGKIDIGTRHSYVAIVREQAERALAAIRSGKIKGRTFRARLLD